MSVNPLLALHKEICDEARALMERKNHDYTAASGDPFANFRGSTYLGIKPELGVLLRMQDKMMRVRTFVEKGQLKVKGESVKDALIDLINYTGILYGLVREERAESATEGYPAEAFLGDPQPLLSGASAREWLASEAKRNQTWKSGR